MKFPIGLLVATVLAAGVTGCASDDYGHGDHGGYGHEHDRSDRGDHGGHGDDHGSGSDRQQGPS
jgi:hypothetical protein